jgi:hypothetical protein
MRATEDIQQEIINTNLSKCLKQAETFAQLCNLNQSLAARVKDLKAAEPVQDGLSRELVAAQQVIKDLEEELQIKKHHSANL